MEHGVGSLSEATSVLESSINKPAISTVGATTDLACASVLVTLSRCAVADTCLKTFDGHDASVLRVQFCSSGMQLLSTGADGLMKLWTIRTNTCANTFEVRAG